jgi:hypothetical protein
MMREEPMGAPELIAFVVRFISYVKGAASMANNKHMMEYADSTEKEVQRFIRDQTIATVTNVGETNIKREEQGNDS